MFDQQPTVDDDLTAEPALFPADPGDPWNWLGYVVVIAAVGLIAYLVTRAALWLTALPSRRAREAHWSERARLLYPARSLGIRCVVLITPALAFTAGREGRRIDLLPPVVTICLLVLTAWAGVVAGRIGWESRLNPAMALTPRPRRAAWIMQSSIWGVLILFGFVMYACVPPDGGPASWVMLFFGMAIVTGYLRWGWFGVMRACGLMRPAADRFRSIVASISDRAKVHSKQVVTVGLPMANAFAMPPQQALGITDAALAVLSDEELSAVAAHETGHLSEPPLVRAKRLLSQIIVGAVVAAPAAVSPVIVSSGPLPGLFALMVGSLALLGWTVWHRRFYRKMEERADSVATALQTESGTYSRALEKLYETNLVPLVTARTTRKGTPSKRGAYPDLYDRMVAAGAPPDYPRPSPPPEWLTPFGIAVVLVLLAVGCVGIDRLASFFVNG